MTANPDLPTAEDQRSPLLAPDDPRLGADAQEDQKTAQELFDGPEEKTPLVLQCPLCGEEVQTQYVNAGSKPCPTHDGEVHEQVWIDARPMNAHEDKCLMYRVLNLLYPDVHQEEPEKHTLEDVAAEFGIDLPDLQAEEEPEPQPDPKVEYEECASCGGSGYASTMDGRDLGTCPTCDGWGHNWNHDTPGETPS